MKRLLWLLLLAPEAGAVCSKHYQPGAFPTLTIAIYYTCATQAERPAGSNDGDMAYSFDTDAFSVWDSGAWTDIGVGGGAAWGSITGTLSNQTDLSTALAAKVPTARSVATTAPLAGGGDLSSDRTLSVATFGSGASGVVPASGGGSSNFLRADGTWTAPPGGSGGNYVAATVDFGAGSDSATVSVTGQAWVTASSVIACQPTLFATTDRDDGADDAFLEGLRCFPTARVAGTGFDVTCWTDGDPGLWPAQPQGGPRAPRGQDLLDIALGKFLIGCTGA